MPTKTAKINSNHIEGSRLTHDQTRYIFETNTIGVTNEEPLNVDDIIETANHFRCNDFIIEQAEQPLSEEMIKELRFFYYRGLHEWPRIPGYLRDTCLTAQDTFKRILDYFRIAY